LPIGIDLERFEHFKNAEFRSIEVISATQIKLIFGVQDKARAYDWIAMEFSFSGVSDAKLIEDSKLKFVDMEDGITILQDNVLVFAIGEYNSITNIKDSIFYIIADDIKYTQGGF